MNRTNNGRERRPTPNRRTSDPNRLLKLKPPAGSMLTGLAGDPAVAAVERLLGLDQVNDIYARAAGPDAAAAGTDAAAAFVRRVLADLDVCVDVSPDDLARIPRSGAFVAVANHPFGALDGLALSAVLAGVRPDTKVMANHLLGQVPALRDLLVLVNPFGGAAAAAANLGPVRQALRWLADGHALGAFPAGEVAHLKLRNLLGADGEGAVADPPWSTTIARIVARAGVPVLPVFFDGHNDALFQAVGLVHPKLRTVMLGRALLSKRGARLTLRIGSLVPAKRLATIDSDEAMTGYLRRRTFLLRHGVPRPSVPSNAAALPAPLTEGLPTAGPPTAGPPATVAGSICKAFQRAAAWVRPATGVAAVEPIIPPVDAAAMAAEIDALPPESLLLEHDGMAVIHARAPQIRNVLQEIGRLRETTFRPVGEGTGRAIDLDTFDYDYGHLFIWNRVTREVVGAYRLGRTDELLAAKGRGGLYTSTLFNYKKELLERLNPALEMGRSFVRPEYQRSYAPLLLLWKGIGHFIVRNPRYRYLLGPVSISNSYQTVSRHLMVQFLKLHHAMPNGEALARPRNPFRPGRSKLFGAGRWDDPAVRELLADEDVSSLVADLEPDQKGIPVLVRQYLKLGAKFLAFNVDRDFGDCLDGLIVVDLVHTDPRTLERYMTKAGYAAFMAHHKAGAGVAQLV